MYKVKIKMRNGEIIEMIVNDVNSPEMKELFYSPNVAEVYINSMEQYKLERKL